MKFLARFAGYWAAFAGLVATGGGCPCCGSGVCVRGSVVLGLLGAAFTAFLKSKHPSVGDSSPEVGSNALFASHATALEFPRHEKSSPPT